MVNSFAGRYNFLSNFFDAPVTYNGITYRNNEAAFQAQKATCHRLQQDFSDLQPGQAKRKGRRVALRDDWEQVKDRIMYEICRCKFEQNQDCLNRLIATGEEELVEGNIWNDTYWGVCNGVGENHLGKILMRIRTELR